MIDQLLRFLIIIKLHKGFLESEPCITRLGPHWQ